MNSNSGKKPSHQSFWKNRYKVTIVSAKFPPLVINSVFTRHMVLPQTILSLMVRNVWHVTKASVK